MSLRQERQDQEKVQIIDFAWPFDNRTEEMEKDKMKGYNDLKRESKKIWDIPVKVNPYPCSNRCIRNDNKEIKVVVERYRN